MYTTKQNQALASTVLVDDQHAVRDLLSVYLSNGRANNEVVGLAGNGTEGLAKINELRPTLVIIDTVLPDMPILDFLKKAREADEHTLFIAFCRWVNEESAINLAAANVRGIVLKEQPLDHLQAAIRSVLGGACYFPSALEKAIWQGKQPGHTLTERESTALRLIAEGYATKQVGDRMNISVKTAEKYRERIMAKLKVHDVVSLTRYAIRNGFATL